MEEHAGEMPSHPRSPPFPFLLPAVGHRTSDRKGNRGLFH
jgi:hypothetical protein